MGLQIVAGGFTSAEAARESGISIPMALSKLMAVTKWHTKQLGLRSR